MDASCMYACTHAQVRLSRHFLLFLTREVRAMLSIQCACCDYQYPYCDYP
jgi:hypothetical protein